MTTKSLLDRAGALAGLVLVAITFGILIGPQFFSPVNLELILRQTAIVSTAALGMTMIIAAGGDRSLRWVDDRPLGRSSSRCCSGRARRPASRRSVVWRPLRSVARSMACS